VKGCALANGAYRLVAIMPFTEISGPEPGVNVAVGAVFGNAIFFLSV